MISEASIGRYITTAIRVCLEGGGFSSAVTAGSVRLRAPRLAAPLTEAWRGAR
jgi:hypothetical protein